MSSSVKKNSKTATEKFYYFTGFHWLNKSVYCGLRHAILSQYRDSHQRKQHATAHTPNSGRFDIDLVHSGVLASTDLLSRF